MLSNRTLITASNLNSAYISQTNTNPQGINSTLTISGGAITLKNSSITDNASSSYLRISPQGNQLILYDGVHNQQLSVFSTSGTESTYITSINGSPSYGLIDISGSLDHLGINTNSGKPINIGGVITTSSTINGSKLTLNNPNSHLQFLESGNNTWHIESVNKTLNFVETGVANRVTLSPSTGDLTLLTGALTAVSGIRIKGSNWLSYDDYGGGFNMTDTTWIRTAGSKSFYHDSGLFRTDGTLQVGSGGATLNVPNGGAFNYGNGKFTIQTNGQVNTTGPIFLGTNKSQGSGIKLDGVTIDTVGGTGGDIGIGGLNQLRFGTSTTWNWNEWAGIKYDSTASKLYIGGPASAHFSANTSPPTIDMAFVGVGHVGVGTDSPTKTIDINGDIRTNGYYYSATGQLDFLTDAGGALPIYVGSLTIANDYHANTAPANGLYVQGGVGIGTPNPSYTLDVNGAIRAMQGIYSTPNNAEALYVGSNSAIWDVNTANTIGVYGQQNTAVGALKLGSTGPTLYGSGGSLGIGTTTPSSSYVLDTVGDIRIGSNYGLYSGYNNNFFLKDHGNGNVTLSAVGSSLYLGYQNTSSIILSSKIVNSSSTNIVGTDGTLYYKGQDIDTRYMTSAGGTVTGNMIFSGTLTANSTASFNSSVSIANTLSLSNYINMNNHYITNISYLYGYYGTMMASYDEYLRINYDGTHTSGVHFGSSTVQTTGTMYAGNMYINGYQAYHAGNISSASVSYASNAGTVNNYYVGNSNSQVPVSNGNLCNNLNAQYLNGYSSSNFFITSNTTSVSGLTTFTQYLTVQGSVYSQVSNGYGYFKYDDSNYVRVGAGGALIYVGGVAKASWSSLPKVRVEPSGEGILDGKEFGVNNSGSMQPSLEDFMIVQLDGQQEIFLDEKFLAFVDKYFVNIFDGNAKVIEKRENSIIIEGHGEVALLFKGIQKGKTDVVGYSLDGEDGFIPRKLR